MKNIINNKWLITNIAVAICAGMFTNSANSATQNMTAEVNFVNAITFSNPNNVDFGNISTTIADTETVIIRSYDNQISGTGSAKALSGAKAGSVDITADGSRTIDIKIDNISSANSAIFALAAPTCEYNSAGTDTACGGGDSYSVTTPGGGGAQTLKIGMKLTKGSTAASVQQYTETFDVTADYQ